MITVPPLALWTGTCATLSPCSPAREPRSQPDPKRGQPPRSFRPDTIVITTNRPFSEWAAVFQSATCVGTLLDRLCHRVEIVQIAGESWRLKESMERSARPRTRLRNPT